MDVDRCFRLPFRKPAHLALVGVSGACPTRLTVPCYAIGDMATSVPSWGKGAEKRVRTAPVIVTFLGTENMRGSMLGTFAAKLLTALFTGQFKRTSLPTVVFGAESGIWMDASSRRMNPFRPT